MNKYIQELPRPIRCDMPTNVVDIQPGAVPYHRKKLKKPKKCMKGQRREFAPYVPKQSGLHLQ